MTPARMRSALALLALAFLTLPATANAARVPACPDSVGAPSAIVVEVSTGTIACGRAIDKRRPIGSTTKLMTALLTLEEAKLSDTFTASDYVAAPVESKIGLVRGERMKVSLSLASSSVSSAVISFVVEPIERSLSA